MTFHVYRTCLYFRIAKFISSVRLFADDEEDQTSSQNLKVIETRNIPDGTDYSGHIIIKRVWRKKWWVAILAKEDKAFTYIPGLLLYRHLY